MTQNIFLQILSAFGAGFIASLSPCVYPMLPITVGYFGRKESYGHKVMVAFFVVGQVVTLTVLGLVAVRLGETFGFSTESKSINIFVGVFLFVMGLFTLMASGKNLPKFLNRLNNKINEIGSKQNRGLIEPFILGVGAALVTSPCTTPILSAVLALMATSSTLFRGTTIMFFYALGFSCFLALVSLGMLNLKKLPRSGVWMQYVHKISGVLLVLTGMYYVARGSGFL
jgi:thiol:disulfide interchange protein DsbD